jgi:DUF2934 family protein
MSSTVAVDRSEITDRAYARWQQRGCPVGSPDYDWYEAEQELLHERQAPAEASEKPVLLAAPEPAEKKSTSRARAPRGRITSPLTLSATADADAEAQSEVRSARAAAIPRPNKRRKVAR